MRLCLFKKTFTSVHLSFIHYGVPFLLFFFRAEDVWDQKLSQLARVFALFPSHSSCLQEVHGNSNRWWTNNRQTKHPRMRSIDTQILWISSNELLSLRRWSQMPYTAPCPCGPEKKKKLLTWCKTFIDAKFKYSFRKSHFQCAWFSAQRTSANKFLDFTRWRSEMAAAAATGGGGGFHFEKWKSSWWENCMKFFAVCSTS